MATIQFNEKEYLKNWYAKSAFINLFRNHSAEFKGILYVIQALDRVYKVTFMDDELYSMSRRPE